VIRIHETVFRARVSTTFAEWTADFERLRTVRCMRRSRHLQENKNC
jgi:hypothetical protein